MAGGNPQGSLEAKIPEVESTRNRKTNKEEAAAMMEDAQSSEKRLIRDLDCHQIILFQ